MEQRQLGQTGIEVSCIGVGGWPIHHQADERNDWNFEPSKPGTCSLVRRHGAPNEKTISYPGGKARMMLRPFPLGRIMQHLFALQIIEGSPTALVSALAEDRDWAIVHSENVPYFPEFLARAPGVDDADAIAAIEKAAEIGINLIEADGGNAQPGGRSERLVGEAISGNRGRWVLASKSHRRDRQGFEHDLQVSLQTLNTDYIDIYQIHQCDWQHELEQVLSPNGALAALEAAKQSGVIRAIGLTSHNEAILLQAAESGRFDVLTFPFGVYSRWAEKKLIPLCRERGIGTIAIKSLGGGYCATGLAQVPGLPTITPAEAAGYAVGEGGTTAVLVGIRSVSEAEALGDAGCKNYSAEQRAEVLQRARVWMAFIPGSLSLTCEYGAQIDSNFLGVIWNLKAFPWNVYAAKQYLKEQDFGNSPCLSCEHASCPLPDVEQIPVANYVEWAKRLWTCI